MPFRLLGYLVKVKWKHISLSQVQWILAYPNLSYPNTLIIQMPKVTVLLEYFVICAFY